VLARFPVAWPETRAALHGHARAMSLLPRRHAHPHPEWWHVGLEIGETGPATTPITLPTGGVMVIAMDLTSHEAVATTSAGEERRWSLATTPPGSLADALAAFGASHGLGPDPTPDDLDRAAPRYDPAAAAVFWGALRDVASVFDRHMAALPGDRGVTHLWPHGFDLSVEWYGRRLQPDDHGKLLPTRLNLGFDPGPRRQYFYSNPWPFDRALLGTSLPEGASWHTDDWLGTMLPYELVADDPAGLDRLARYAAAVFAAASPTL